MLYVATPCYGCQMTKGYLGSLLTLQGECMRRGVQCLVDFVGNESLVCRARNIMAARFMQTPGATHLLFIDADITFNPETVFRLLDSGKDVVTAVYPKKHLNWPAVDRHLAALSAASGSSPDDAYPNASEPLHQVPLDFNLNIDGVARAENGFVRVLDAATGFMMISRSAMERMYAAYRDELYAVNDIPGTGPNQVRDYVAVFATMIDPKTKRYLSEDFAATRRWQAIGGEVWADMASPLVHVGTHTWTGDIRHRLK